MNTSDFRRVRAPNKKKYDEEKEELLKEIANKDAEMKSLAAISPEQHASQLRDLRDEREASVNKRKKIDTDLRLLNQEITKKMGQLSRTESNLHYKNEQRIDDTIRKLELQLNKQNFRLSEERRVVGEIDKLKRSKKVLEEYLIQKREVDKLRDSQRRIRSEKDHLYRVITGLNKRDEELRRSSHDRKAKYETLKKELDQLHESKRQLFAEYKQCESEYHYELKQRKSRKRNESFRRQEEARKAKEEAWQKERLEFECQRQPYEDEINLCNTLIAYTQRFSSDREDVAVLPSPREENPHPPLCASSSFGPADSLDDGKLILLKKSEDPEVVYSVANKPRRHSKKGRKLSTTKPLAHTPQILAQFSSLKMEAPVNVARIPATLEQLQIKKQYFEEQASQMPRPLLGNLSGSFSSSGSFSGSFSGSLDSPMRERSTTWGIFEVPPAITETQTSSEAGESGFHDMSRQASKTESSESATDSAQCDQALEEIIKQSAEYQGSETSRSSSDTITPDEQTDEQDRQSSCHSDSNGSHDIASPKSDSCHGNTENIDNTDNPVQPDNHSRNLSRPVFEESARKSLSLPLSEDIRKGGNLSVDIPKTSVCLDLSSKIVNYDKDFPTLLGNEKAPSDTEHCDSLVTPSTTDSGYVSSSNSVWLNIGSGESENTTGSMSQTNRPSDHTVSASDVSVSDPQSVFLEKESVKGIEGSLGGPTLDLSEKDQLKDLQGCLDSMHLIDHKTSPKATSLSLECEDEAVVRDFEETEDVVTHL
ncbi:uncharacterized protein LOC128205845 isoform X2 [Mya arenaria]|nr:uncharacterized protein LOC128205845 isoform X2 [Mya arenaria]